MIVCLRTLGVPADVRDRHPAWIAAGRQVRQHHNILAELVLQPSSRHLNLPGLAGQPDVYPIEEEHS